MIEWYYYNRALLPICAPHETPDLSALDDISPFLKQGQKPLFARWTSDYDHTESREWYYVIKDTPFDLSALKAKRRYEITKGMRNFTCRVINTGEYAEDICRIYEAANASYPTKNRVVIDREQFIEGVKNWTYITYGAFDQNDVLCAYLNMHVHDEFMDMVSLKADPAFEKLSVNAAIIYTMLQNQETFLKTKYICNGERNLVHETNFMEYLEKNFLFRKAYCNLNICYFGKMRYIVKVLYPFRGLFCKINIKLFNQISAVLKMEEITRKQRKANA